MSVFHDSRILSQSNHRSFHLPQHHHQRQEQHRIDDPGPIQVHPAQPQLPSPIGLTHQRLNSTIQAHKRLEAQDSDQCGAEAYTGQFGGVVEVPGENRVYEVC